MNIQVNFRLCVSLDWVVSDLLQILTSHGISTEALELENVYRIGDESQTKEEIGAMVCYCMADLETINQLIVDNELNSDVQSDGSILLW